MTCPTVTDVRKYVNEVVACKSFEQADLALDTMLVHIASCMQCYRLYLSIVHEYKASRN